MTFERITCDPKRNAEPCIRQLRLTVRRVVEAVAIFPDRRDLLQEYPELEEEDIRQALAYAEANRPQSSKPSIIERRLSSFVYSLGFLVVFFLVEAIALAIGFYSQPGIAIMALLAVCPFLLPLGLLEVIRNRRLGGSIFATIQELVMYWGFSGYLCYFAVCLLRGRDMAYWASWFLLFMISFSFGYSRPCEGEVIDARSKRRRFFGMFASRL